MDRLAACALQREVGAGLVTVPFELAYDLRILPANEKQEKVAGEIFQTPLTNKKQGKLEDTCE